MSRTSVAAFSGEEGKRRAASSLFSVIRERLWPSRSCRSRAKRRRSSATARRAISSRAARNSAMVSMLFPKAVNRRPRAPVDSTPCPMSDHPKPEALPKTTMRIASPAIAAYASLLGSNNPASTLTWKKSVSHSFPQASASASVRTTRDASAARRLRTSETSVAAARSGWPSQINPKKTATKSVVPARAKRICADDGFDFSRAWIGYASQNRPISGPNNRPPRGSRFIFEPFSTRLQPPGQALATSAPPGARIPYPILTFPEGVSSKGSEFGYGRDYLCADDLQRRYPIHARDDADHRLDAHAGEPAQPSDQLTCLLAVLPYVEGERAGLLDQAVVPAFGLAVPAENVELPRDLRARTETAGVGVACDQAQGLSLAVTGDHNRRVGPAQALREVERTLEPVVSSLKGALVAPLAAPHPQGYLERFLQHLEPLCERREGDPQPAGLLFVVSGLDVERGGTPGEHVQRGNRLCQDRRVSEVHPRHHRRELGPLCVGGKERQRRVALRFVHLRAAHDGVLPEVVRHADAVEPRLFSGLSDVRESPSESLRSSVPVEAVELQSEPHEPILRFRHPVSRSSSHSVVMRRLVWMSMCRACPVPELTNLCGTPAGATTICPPVASTLASPTVKVRSPTLTTK